MPADEYGFADSGRSSRNGFLYGLIDFLNLEIHAKSEPVDAHRPNVARALRRPFVSYGWNLFDVLVVGCLYKRVRQSMRIARTSRAH